MFAQLTEQARRGYDRVPREGRSCDCDQSAVLDLASAGSYSTAAGQVISGSASAAYCVSGDQLQYEAALGGVGTALRR